MFTEEYKDSLPMGKKSYSAFDVSNGFTKGIKIKLIKEMFYVWKTSIDITNQYSILTPYYGFRPII